MNQKNSFVKKDTVASLCLSGGHNDNIFYCQLEAFQDSKRWFLASLLQFKEIQLDSFEIGPLSVLGNTELKNLIVDIPLSDPLCTTCPAECQGGNACVRIEIQEINRQINDLLERDRLSYLAGPKKYESHRCENKLLNFSDNFLGKNSCDDLLSKSFKRRLKKGFLPYWNRPIDLWIWFHYFDPWMKYFNGVYDSFGNISLKLFWQWQHFKKNIPSEMHLYQSHPQIILLELLRAKIITKNQLINLSSLDCAIDLRLEVLRGIEVKLGLFIYDHDQEILIKNERAFMAMILALSGMRLLMGKSVPLPEWSQNFGASFLIPQF